MQAAFQRFLWIVNYKMLTVYFLFAFHLFANYLSFPRVNCNAYYINRIFHKLFIKKILNPKISELLVYDLADFQF